MAGLALGSTGLALTRDAPVRHTGVARIELPVPPPPACHLLAGTDLAAGTAPVESGGADCTLLDHGPFEPLPRIGPDGRRPFLAYAHSSNLEDRRPKVAVLLVGLGLQRDLVDALPAPIRLQFSPDAADLIAMLERARRAGHDDLLDVAMEPADDPASNPGPPRLLAGVGRDWNLKRPGWLLARATGCFALAGGGTRFAGSDGAAGILDVLARRGLTLIEPGERRLAAAAAGLPCASARQAIDDEPSVPLIEYALAAIEADAWATGSALGVARGYPMSLERLRRWAATLDAKRPVLAAASAVLIEQAGLAGELWDGRRAAARSEG